MKVLFALGISFGLAVFTAPQTPAPAASDVTVSLRMAQSFSLNEPIVATVVVSNKSKEDLRLNLGWFQVGRLQFEMTGPDNQSRTARPMPPNFGGISPIDETVLSAGAELRRWVVLNQWLDFKTPGRYDLRVHFDGNVERLSRQPVSVARDWAVSLVVGERDSPKLQERYQALAHDAVTSQSPDTQELSVTALAYSKDRAAVPFLASLVESNRLIWIAIPGLERIGGEDAIAALRKIAKSGSPEAAALAAAGLQRLTRQ